MYINWKSLQYISYTTYFALLEGNNADIEE